jgi:hypothetical protein
MNIITKVSTTYMNGHWRVYMLLGTLEFNKDLV